jgi:hypothetical protein
METVPGCDMTQTERLIVSHLILLKGNTVAYLRHQDITFMTVDSAPQPVLGCENWLSEDERILN